MHLQAPANVTEVLHAPRGVQFYVINHGCKVNRVEADTFAARLLALGATSCKDDASAELVIVNTCTVTAEADKKARKAIRHALKVSPSALVVVTGCGASIDPYGYQALGDRVEVIDKASLLEKMEQGLAGSLRYGTGFRTRVNLKVQDGCNHACTYCIVHVARGTSRSVPFSAVVDEARAYLARGAKELVLAGIDLASYHDGAYDLTHLVESLIELADEACAPGQAPARVRASSLEPMTVTESFIDLLASSQGRLCRHMHLPLQSGSTKVLREMARPYTAQHYLQLVNHLYERVPQLALTTDIIAGFPGETDDEFEQTLELARACRFSKIHVFPYSRRQGTPAAIRPDQVEPNIVRQRTARLRALSEELRARDLQNRRGTSELVLVESDHALTESYHEVPVPPNATEGALVPYLIR